MGDLKTSASLKDNFKVAHAPAQAPFFLAYYSEAKKFHNVGIYKNYFNVCWSSREIKVKQGNPKELVMTHSFNKDRGISAFQMQYEVSNLHLDMKHHK